MSSALPPLNRFPAHSRLRVRHWVTLPRSLLPRQGRGGWDQGGLGAGVAGVGPGTVCLGERVRGSSVPGGQPQKARGHWAASAEPGTVGGHTAAGLRRVDPRPAVSALTGRTRSPRLPCGRPETALPRTPPRSFWLSPRSHARRPPSDLLRPSCRPGLTKEPRPRRGARSAPGRRRGQKRDLQQGAGTPNHVPAPHVGPGRPGPPLPPSAVRPSDSLGWPVGARVCAARVTPATQKTPDRPGVPREANPVFGPAAGPMLSGLGDG